MDWYYGNLFGIITELIPSGYSFMSVNIDYENTSWGDQHKMGLTYGKPIYRYPHHSPDTYPSDFELPLP